MTLPRAGPGRQSLTLPAVLLDGRPAPAQVRIEAHDDARARDGGWRTHPPAPASSAAQSTQRRAANGNGRMSRPPQRFADRVHRVLAHDLASGPAGLAEPIGPALRREPAITPEVHAPRGLVVGMPGDGWLLD